MYVGSEMVGQEEVGWDGVVEGRSHTVWVSLPHSPLAGLEVRERSELLQLDFQGYPLLQQVLEGT